MKKKFMKRLSLLLAIVMALSACFAVIAAGEMTYPTTTGPYVHDSQLSGKCGDNLTYTLDNETDTLTIEGTGGMYDIDFDDEDYEKNPILTVIYDFYTVVITSGVTYIDSEYFSRGYANKFIVAGDNASYCSDSDGVLFNKDKTVLVLCSTDDETNTYTVPDSVTEIGEFAFFSCPELEKIIFTDNSKLTKIDNNAFIGCYSLVELSIPKGVMSIGNFDDDFSYCLTEYRVDEGNAYFSSDSEGVLFNKDKTVLIKYPYGREDNSYTMPDSVEEIADRAFYYTEVSDVVFSKNLKIIGDYAFAQAELRNVALPSSVTHIGDKALNMYYGGCTVRVEKDSKLDYIGEDAFILETIYCFRDSFIHKYCENNDVDFVLIDGTDEESIVGGVCGRNVKWSLDKRSGVFTLSGDGKMNGYTHLDTPWYGYERYFTSLEVGADITNIGNYAFNNSDLYSVTFEAGSKLETIGLGAFANNYHLKKLELPQGVKDIGSMAFNYCTGLEECNFPEALETVGYGAFQKTNLKNVYIPVKLTDIGYIAFADCPLLASFTISPDNTEYEVENGILFNKGKTVLIFVPANGDITDFTVAPSVTEISDYAFKYCKRLESITIGSGVTQIGEFCFEYCENLKRVDFNGCKITAIGYGTFERCYSLEDIVIPESVTEINSNAFSSCKALKSLVIPENVWYVGYNVFYECNADVTVENPRCEFDDSFCDGNTIYGYTNSTAESYALQNGLDFVSIGVVEPFIDEECGCICHSNGIKRLFYKFILIFWKIFRTNEICDCGLYHY